MKLVPEAGARVFECLIKKGERIGGSVYEKEKRTNRKEMFKKKKI